MKILIFALLAIGILPVRLSAAEPAPLHLVVQQNGQALVNEVRTLALPKGSGTVVLQDLPATIDAQTLQVRSKTSPQSLRILDLDLDEEILSPSTLLKHFIGKQVNLILPDGKTREGRVQKEALVLSTEEAPLFLIDGQVYSGPVEAIIYPELPQNLAAHPRISMHVANSGPARQGLELTYMAREISWRMDYVLHLNKDASSGLLSGWVTLTNRSGKDFAQARVELLAGAPGGVRPATRGLMAAAMPMAKDIALAAQGDTLYEYHIYRIMHPVSLANLQSRQVQLFESATVPVTRKLIGRAAALPTGRETEPAQQRLDAILSFQNTAAQGLGLALPEGTLRAMQDESAVPHFLGETTLPSAAIGATVEARLGQAFDLNVERVVTQFEKTGKSSYRAAWELHIRNAKKQTQRIILQEQIPGKWKVQDASHTWSKPAAGVLEFTVDAPPTGDGAPLVLKYSFTTEL